MPNLKLCLLEHGLHTDACMPFSVAVGGLPLLSNLDMISLTFK